MDLQKVKEVKIPRCYSWNVESWDELQLHLFCDASEKAFTTVAYFTFQEDISCAMVMARTHVAPLKPMSIPRLELQAAVMASRIAQTVRMEHETTINKCHFWTDSKTVLCWLHSDVHKFKMFVAHRIGEIEELTDLCDWHWVPSKENVADDATRNTYSTDFSAKSRW